MSSTSLQQELLQGNFQRLRRIGFIVFLVVIWYYFSYEYNTRLKAWLSTSRPAVPAITVDNSLSSATAQLTETATSWLSPITMPLLVAIFATTTAATLPWVLHSCTATPQLIPAWKFLWTHHTLDMCLMCASTVMGTASITVVYEYGSIQLVQVARSVGPLFTTVWAVLLLDQITNGKPLACLFASLGGTMLASWKEPTLCMMTVVLMLAANSCMTFRNVITRRLLAALGIGKGHHSPASPQRHLEHTNSGKVINPLRPTTSSQIVQPEYSTIPSTHMAGLLLTTGNAAGCAALVVLLIAGSMSGSQAAVQLARMPFDSVRQLLILGGTNWAYNLASQLVLAQLTVVSHGMLELLKRVFVLVAVSLFAQSAHWHWHNMVGAAITFVAAGLYFKYSHAHHPAPAHTHTHSHSDTKAARTDSLDNPSSAKAGVSTLFNSLVAPRNDVLQSPGRRDQGTAFREKQLSMGGSSSGGGAIDGAAMVHITDAGRDSKEIEPLPQSTAPSACSSCLPPAGPRRLSLARSVIVGIMICTLPLLLPTGFWSVNSFTGPTAEYHLLKTHTSLPASGLVATGTTLPDVARVASGSAELGVKARRVPEASTTAAGPVWGSGEDARLPGSDLDTVMLLPAEAVPATTQTSAVNQPDAEDRRRLGRDQADAQTMQAKGKGGKQAWKKGKSHLHNKHEQLMQKVKAAITAQAAQTANPAQTIQAPKVAIGRRLLAMDASPAVLHGIYLGWLGHDNLGDEIVADIFYELLRQGLAGLAPKGATVQVMPEVDAGLSRKYAGCGVNKEYNGCHFAVIGGGSTVDVPFIQAAKPMLEAKKPVLLFGGGYQRVWANTTVQDMYLRLLMDANTTGGIRGPITSEFLMNHVKATLPIIGDSGFLSDALFPGNPQSLVLADKLPAKIPPGHPVPNWPPKPECLEASRQVHSRTSQLTNIQPVVNEAPGSPCERPLIVATLRTALESTDLFRDGKHLVDEADIEQLKVPRHPIAIMMLMIQELVNEHHFQVVLQAVDDKSLTAHERYVAMINRRIRPGNPPVTLHNAHASYSGVMELYERAAVTVNCRLHSGVLSAAALRPTVYMASLPKFADFMNSIGQDEYMIKPDRADLRAVDTIELAKLMVSKVLHATTNAAAISSQLQTVRDDMLARYHKAVRTFLDRLAVDEPAAFQTAITNCPSITVRRSTCISERTVIAIQCEPQA